MWTPADAGAMASSPAIITGEPRVHGSRGRSPWPAVALLLVVYASSFVDRQIMSLLVMPIRADLVISDSQFSLLNGLAFALFYATLGVPIARWVDRGDRGVILAIGASVWSIFTMVCGLATTFGALFLARMGVGAGEATLVPCIYSLLADYFPPQRRGLAMGIFGSGVYVGMGLALIVGGTVLHMLGRPGSVTLGPFGNFAPWQLAFLIVGAPGLLLAALVLLLWEPRRGRHERAPVATARTPHFGLMSTWRESFRVLAGHHLASGFLAMALYGMVAWAPEYLRRTFDIDIATGAYQIGIVLMVFGTCGVVAGGVLSDLLLRHGIASARVIVLASAGALAAPCLTFFAFASSVEGALACIACSTFFLSMLTSCGPLGVQELYPSRARAQGAAIFQLLVTLLGAGVGPAAIAAVSDFLLAPSPALGPALGIATPIWALAATVAAIVAISPYNAAVGRAADPHTCGPVTSS
jgi:predicted MFS family arabinose efflux permease